MKNILFVIDSLGVGGAEKSLITLLNCLPKSQYNIDLLLIRNEGLFLKQLPQEVNRLTNIFPLQFLGISTSNIIFYLKKSPIYLLKKIIRYQLAKRNKKLSTNQSLWKLWKKDIKPLTKKYDTAISYLEGIPNYFVIDKVQAKKKILWIHNEYTKLNYNKFFDTEYFNKADKIVTISLLCKKCLVENFPCIPENKFEVLENISNTNYIKKLAEAQINDPTFINRKGSILVSVGRLVKQKGYDIALKSAFILKEKGISFSWFIIGEGPLRNELEQMSHNLGLENYVHLIGIRSNPYPYIKQADIIVQSSRYEGKSIVLDEAKILQKPIISTNYDTVKDVINNNINGIITEMSAEALSSQIIKLINDVDLRNKLINNLKEEAINNQSELYKYLHIID